MRKLLLLLQVCRERGSRRRHTQGTAGSHPGPLPDEAVAMTTTGMCAVFSSSLYSHYCTVDLIHCSILLSQVAVSCSTVLILFHYSFITILHYDTATLCIIMTI